MLKITLKYLSIYQSIFNYKSFLTSDISISGHWSAWLLGEDGEKLSWGIIPSKYKVEEELLLKRPLRYRLDKDVRGGDSMEEVEFVMFFSFYFMFA